MYPAYSSPLLPQCTFERFIVGDGNRIACNAAKAAATCPPDRILVISAQENGCGRTHLLMAAGHETLRLSPEKNVCFLTADDLTEQIISALNGKRFDAFRQDFGHVDLLLLDDLHTLRDRPATTKLVVKIMQRVCAEGGSVLTSVDRALEDLPEIAEPLTAASAEVTEAHIRPNDTDTARALLSCFAQRKKLSLTEETEALVLTRLSSASALLGAVNYLSALQDLHIAHSEEQMLRHILGLAAQ